MLLLRPRSVLRPPADSRRGAALMLSILVLLVLVAVVFQINIATTTDARVARNDVVRTAMDLAFESVLLDQFEVLKADAADEGGGAGAGSSVSGGLGGALAGAGGLPGMGGAAGGAEGGAESGPTDSRRDEWASPGRADAVGKANGINVRIMIQDENSKYNVLTMLTEDEEEADKAFRRVVRIIDLFREGTDVDLDGGEAERIAELMRDHLMQETEAARALLVTDDPEGRDARKPMLSLREIVQYEELGRIEASVGAPLFRDFRTEDGTIVHSLSSYLTTWTSLQTLEEFQEAQADQGSGTPVAAGQETEEQGGESSGNQGNLQTTGAFSSGGDASGATSIGDAAGGGSTGLAVNVNTAPPVVLKALMDDDEVDPRFWDEVIAYRNEEDEEAMDAEGDDTEPMLDEFGEELVLHRFFASVDELSDVRDWERIEPGVRDDLVRLVDVKSDVFTIYLTARKDTSGRMSGIGTLTREEVEEQERLPTNLARTIACTVWRRSTDGGVEIIPLQRWEYLDYTPWEVLDFPDEGR